MRALWRNLAVLLLASAAVVRAQEPVRVADAACATCHQEIVARYLHTPMANASGPAMDHLLPGELTQAGSGVHYRVAEQQGVPYLSFDDLHDPRIGGRHRLEYFLGSGHLGVTYLYEQEGYLLESPVAWYAATRSYDMKPGFGRMQEMPPALPMQATCLRCHMSGVRAAEMGSENRYAGLPFAQTGITCEGCHGDTAAHVKSGGKAPVVNPVKLDAERRDSVCLSCHLEGDVTVKRAGHSVLDYRPGDRIGDYLSYFVYASNDPLARGVSEVEQLAASRCKRTSGDRMSCMSCHDPHGTEDAATPAERVAFYRGKCLACHSAPAFAATHHPETPDCTGCHMPRNGSQDVPHVAWTDHRILRVPQPRTTGADGAKVLTAIFSPEVDARDWAMARYMAVMGGLSSDKQGALAGLKQAYAAGAHDVAVLQALGVMDAFSGQAAEAEARLRELLAKDPTNVTALSDLAIYLARRGQLEEAVAMWQKAFARNADNMELARNLAVTQCALGQSAAATQTLQKALTFSPSVRAARDFVCNTPAAPAH